MKVTYLANEEIDSFEIKHLIFMNSLAILTNGKNGDQIFIRKLSPFLLQHNYLRFLKSPKVIAIDLIEPDITVEYNKKLAVIYKGERLEYKVDFIEVTNNFITFNISDFINYCDFTNQLSNWGIDYMHGQELDWIIVDMENLNLIVELWS